MCTEALGRLDRYRWLWTAPGLGGLGCVLLARDARKFHAEHYSYVPAFSQGATPLSVAESQALALELGLSVQ